LSAGFQPTFDFEAANEAAEDGAALVIDIDGYEGPLHVLLALARSQKVDLLQLSITKLAEQYLAFVQQARRVRFSLAADYLVMAAWLAYLKSRLLLPKPERAKAEEPPAEEMAAQLAFRLAKLDVMRKAVEALKERPILGRDVFMRGDPEAVKIVSSTRAGGRPLQPDERLHHPAQARAQPPLRPASADRLSAGGRPRPPAQPAAEDGRLDGLSTVAPIERALEDEDGPRPPRTWPRPSRPRWSW
jgi:segregation and condensation protein A